MVKNRNSKYILGFRKGNVRRKKFYFNNRRKKYLKKLLTLEVFYYERKMIEDDNFLLQNMFINHVSQAKDLGRV